MPQAVGLFILVHEHDPDITGFYREHANIELVQPRTRIHLDIGNPPLGGFLKYHLEQEHGDLGLGTHSETSALPPLSPLGHELASSSGKAAAKRLVKHLEERATGNIALALLHLQQISDATSLTAAMAVGERLPPNIVGYFSAAMASIANDPMELRRQLGLASLKHVGEAGDELEFLDLKKKLLESWIGSYEALRTLLESEFAKEQVLAASRGLLVLRRESILVCFHDDFETYVQEQYSDFLL